MRCFPGISGVRMINFEREENIKVVCDVEFVNVVCVDWRICRAHTPSLTELCATVTADSTSAS